jgi:hypothetical protein
MHRPTRAGRTVHTEANPSNAIFNLQGILSDRTTNEFKFGYNAAPTRIEAVLPGGGVDLSASTINLTGSVANFGIAGQGASSGITIPGGLVRSNSAQNGRGQPYDPYTVSFIDSLSSLRGNHFIKTGGELRMIRMETDRLAGRRTRTRTSPGSSPISPRRFSSLAMRVLRASSTTAPAVRDTSSRSTTSATFRMSGMSAGW